MLRRSDALVLNKVDLLPYLQYDLNEARNMAFQVNPALEIFETSCTTCAGIGDFCRWIVNKMGETSAV